MCTTVHIESHWVLSNLARQVLAPYTMYILKYIVNFTSNISKLKNSILKVRFFSAVGGYTLY